MAKMGHIDDGKVRPRVGEYFGAGFGALAVMGSSQCAVQILTP